MFPYIDDGTAGYDPNAPVTYPPPAPRVPLNYAPATRRDPLFALGLVDRPRPAFGDPPVQPGPPPFQPDYQPVRPLPPPPTGDYTHNSGSHNPLAAFTNRSTPSGVPNWALLLAAIADAHNPPPPGRPGALQSMFQGVQQRRANELGQWRTIAQQTEQENRLAETHNRNQDLTAVGYAGVQQRRDAAAALAREHSIGDLRQMWAESQRVNGADHPLTHVLYDAVRHHLFALYTDPYSGDVEPMPALPDVSAAPLPGSTGHLNIAHEGVYDSQAADNRAKLSGLIANSDVAVQSAPARAKKPNLDNGLTVMRTKKELHDILNAGKRLPAQIDADRARAEGSRAGAAATGQRATMDAWGTVNRVREGAMRAGATTGVDPNLILTPMPPASVQIGPNGKVLPLPPFRPLPQPNPRAQAKAAKKAERAENLMIKGYYATAASNGIPLSEDNLANISEAIGHAERAGIITYPLRGSSPNYSAQPRINDRAAWRQIVATLKQEKPLPNVSNGTAVAQPPRQSGPPHAKGQEADSNPADYNAIQKDMRALKGRHGVDVSQKQSEHAAKAAPGMGDVKAAEANDAASQILADVDAAVDSGLSMQKVVESAEYRLASPKMRQLMKQRYILRKKGGR